MTAEVLALICAQEACAAAWEAWLCNRPMTWLATPKSWEFAATALTAKVTP